MPSHQPTSYDEVVVVLRQAGCVFAEDEARLLLAAAASPDALDELVQRRVSGTPLEQVLGWAEFCGLRIAVVAGVFVPRQRTELVVREAIAAIAPGAVVLDLCCGSGAVGAAIVAVVNDIELHAADNDPVAVACARGNLPDSAQVHQGDLYAALPAGLMGTVDVITANAPYVPTNAIASMPAEARLYEPCNALDGGDDGVAVHRRVAVEAPRWLSPGGCLIIETSERQAPQTAAAMTAAGLRATVVRDTAIEATVVTCRV